MSRFSRNKGLVGRVVLTLLLVIVAGGSYLAGFARQWLPVALKKIEESSAFHPAAQEPPEFQVYWEAWSLVEENFDGELPDAKSQVYGSIRGMLAALRDPNTFFIEPPAREIEQGRFQGRYGGIGAEYTMEHGYLVVVTPFPDSPAGRADVRTGDIILAVDGKEIFGLSQNEAIALIRGPVGTKVELTIQRPSEAEPFTIELIREEIQTLTVTWELKEEIGYLKISLFSERTDEELRLALGQLESLGATSLILDLRNNPGGLIQSAVEVTSEFIDKGIILYQKDAHGQEKRFSAHLGGLSTDLPLVILVNGGTASAAEIVAGALQDHGRATLIGETTFGKGSVQAVHELSDGSSIHATTAHWFTPKGHEIEGSGLTPDIETSLTQEDTEAQRDPQLEQAIEYLRSGHPPTLEGGSVGVYFMSTVLAGDPC